MKDNENDPDCPDHTCIAYEDDDSHCYSFGPCKIKQKELIRKKVHAILRVWLPNENYGYNEAVDEIMKLID